tara:strand:- start:82 stop:654 length:573 start_codon:yes stop_codon:yes gene_type:complete
MNDDIKTNERVKAALKIIKEKHFTEAESQGFYNNIMARDDISEDDKELLTNELEVKIRTKQPSLAKKLFGNKETKAREFLEPVFSKLYEEYDWSDNDHESRVKACGDMMNGNYHVCLYISYKKKHGSGISVALAYKQVTPNDDPFISVDIKQVRTKNISGKLIEEKFFSIGSEEDALNFFKQNLSETIGA